MPYSAGGRWVPAPGVSYAPPTPRLAGEWSDVTLQGDSAIEADGYSYPLPLLADLKLVSTGRSTIVHVRTAGRVYIFHDGRQLVENEFRSKARAAPAHWDALGKK